MKRYGLVIWSPGLGLCIDIVVLLTSKLLSAAVLNVGRQGSNR